MHNSSGIWPIARSRASIAGHRRAIHEALRAELGEHEAARLMQDDDRFREPAPRDEAPSSSTERAGMLMDTAQGRAQLAALTWETL